MRISSILEGVSVTSWRCSGARWHGRESGPEWARRRRAGASADPARRRGQRPAADLVLALLHSMLTAAVAIGLVGCTTTKGFKAADYVVPSDQPVSLVVIDPDVEVSLLTTGGVLQPNRTWTEQARASLLAALQANQAARGFAVKVIKPEALPPRQAALFTEYERLHGAVGAAIARYHYGAERLPTKRGRFDWTLGPGAAELGRAVGGTHALFLVARDSFASTGRVLLNVLAAVLGGYAGGGQRFAYASLVDLRSGNIVWFNVLQSEIGDMRTPEGARATIDTLFRTMPAAEVRR